MKTRAGISIAIANRLTHHGSVPIRNWSIPRTATSPPKAQTTANAIGPGCGWGGLIRVFITPGYGWFDTPTAMRPLDPIRGRDSVPALGILRCGCRCATDLRKDA